MYKYSDSCLIIAEFKLNVLHEIMKYHLLVYLSITISITFLLPFPSMFKQLDLKLEINCISYITNWVNNNWSIRSVLHTRCYEFSLYFDNL